MRNIFRSFDENFITIINENMKSRLLDILMPKLTNLGSALFITLFTLSFIVFGEEDLRKIGIQGAATLAISQAITYSLKTLLGRERPYNKLKKLNTFGIILKDYSFPSGHTSASFSIATTIAINVPKLTIVVMALALLVGISRIYLGVHYPTDVVGGIIIGIGSAFVVYIYLINYIYEFVSFIKM